MRKNQVFFHLGLPKVASTFCQQVIFPNLSDVQFFKKSHFNRYKTLPPDKPGKFLFSIETDREMSDRLSAIVDRFENAQVILCFRRHDDWLLSKYKYYIRKNEGMSFTECFDIHHNQGELKQEDIRYRDIIALVESLVKHKPLILTLDMLKENPDDFIKRLTNYMGTEFINHGKINKKVKPSLKDKQLIVVRAFNRLPLPDQIQTKYKLLNKIHGIIRKVSIHIVAFSSYFIPNFLLKNQPLLTEKEENDLALIREIYADDWEFVENYSQQPINANTQL